MDVYNVIILARAVCTYLKIDESKIGKLYNILEFVTEPFLGPLRTMLNKWEVVRAFPVDVTFIVAYILISVLRTYLSALGI